MRSSEDVQKLIRNAEMHSDPETNQAILRDLMHRFDNAQEQKAAVTRPKVRRTIMKSPITKSAAAAVLVAVVVLGMFEFTDTGNKSGVVWADVARRVQASRGTIFRGGDPDGGLNYSMHYHSGTQYRNDTYRGGQIHRTNYGDFNTNTVIAVSHWRKTYTTRTFPNLQQGRFWSNPKSVIQEFLSHEHRELGAKTVESVLCEGIETTDPAFAGVSFPVESLTARLWVSVETGYPIRYEDEIAGYNGEDGALIRSTTVADQFQWDVELEESLFEPDIPADYRDVSL